MSRSVLVHPLPAERFAMRSKSITCLVAAGLLSLTFLQSAAAPVRAAEGGEDAGAVDPDSDGMDARIRLASGRYILAADLDGLALEQEREIRPDLMVTHAGVGVFRPDGRGRLRFVPGDRIAPRPGDLFGWVLRFDTTLDAFPVIETFSLPSRGNWNVNSAATTISPEGDAATTTWTIEPFWDWACNTWGFEEGDPRGAHVFSISLREGPQGRRLIAELPFHIE